MKRTGPDKPESQQPVFLYLFISEGLFLTGAITYRRDFLGLGGIRNPRLGHQKKIRKFLKPVLLLISEEAF